MRTACVLGLLLSSSLVGCGNDAGTATNNDGGAANDATAARPDAAAPPIDASAATCQPSMTYGGGEPSVPGQKTVTAKIVDETGAPVAGQPVYICGLDICSAPATTDLSGSVTIGTNLSEKKPAFKFGDTINYAELAIPLLAATTDFTSGGTMVLTTARLTDAPGAALTPGMDAVSGDVTISVPAGATVGVDSIVYPTPADQELHAVRIPLANDGAVLASSGKTDFALLYGIRPAETPICPPAKVTVALPHATMTPNDLGWAPGTAVEFWIMTTDTGQIYAPYAGWAKTSDGVVSADGTSVTTTQGFLFLETFAIRKAQ